MRYSLKLIPAFLLIPAVSACSYGPQNQEFGYNGASNTHYNGSYQATAVSSQGDLICSSAGCAPSATYSVNNKPSHNYGHAPYQPSYDAYGTQVEKSHGNAGYGHSPQLRGAYGNPGRSGYRYGNLGVVNYDKDSNVYGLQGRLGYQSSGILGAEVEGSFGVSDDKETVGAITAQAGIDYSVGAFALAKVPIVNGLSVHGRGGYHITEASIEIDDGVDVVKASDDADGFAYGVGAEYAFSPRSAIRLDYTRYEGEGDDLEAISLGYSRKF